MTFEELGVDRLFVDEADNYKNLFLYTKMRNPFLTRSARFPSSSTISFCISLGFTVTTRYSASGTGRFKSGKEKKLTQLVFCDLSTPKNDGTFSVVT